MVTSQSQSEEQKYHYGTGRRKSAVARVRLILGGSGKISINDRNVTEEAPTYLAPLVLVGLASAVDISVKVDGGGSVGQAEAIKHGIARAILEQDESLRSTLKKAGFLTRDPRQKERKKFGLKAARRAPQWSKR